MLMKLPSDSKRVSHLVIRWFEIDAPFTVLDNCALGVHGTISQKDGDVSVSCPKIKLTDRFQGVLFVQAHPLISNEITILTKDHDPEYSCLDAASALTKKQLEKLPYHFRLYVINSALP